MARAALVASLGGRIEQASETAATKIHNDEPNEAQGAVTAPVATRDPRPAATLTAADLAWLNALVVDPRPDLARDSAAWSALLRATCADADDPAGLFAALHGLRCEGAMLVAGKGAWRLVPGEIDGAVYAAWRERWLRRHAERLTAALRGLSG